MFENERKRIKFINKIDFCKDSCLSCIRFETYDASYESPCESKKENFLREIQNKMKT